MALPTLGSELRPLYLTQRRYRPVVAVAAYFDDSQDGGTTAIAGYIGPVPMWDNHFSPAWWNVIRAAPHPIREFKAADCRHMTGEFREGLGWTRGQCDALTKDVVSVIVNPRSDVLGIGAAATFTDEELQSNEFRSKLPDVDFEELKRRVLNFSRTWCATMVAHHALRLAENHLGEDRIQIVYDEASDSQSKMQTMFGVLRNLVRPEYSERIRPPHFLPSHELAPLQAADLLAYETYKEVKNRSESPPRAPSRALARLAEGRPHIAHYFRLTDLFKIIEDNKAGDSRSIAFPPIYDPTKTDRIVRDIVAPVRLDDQNRIG